MKERDIWIVLAIVALLFTSCGAKKKVVQKSKTVEKKDLVVRTKDTVSSEVDFSSLINRLRITPKDSTNFEVNIEKTEKGLTVKGNNADVFLETETVDSTATLNTSKEVDLVDKSEKEEKIVDKNIESEGWNWKGLNRALLLIIIILALFVYYRAQK